MAIIRREIKHHSYGEKFGKESLFDGYTQVPNLLLYNMSKLGLDHSEMLLLLMLLSYWHKKDEYPWPSVAALAEKIGRSERHTRRILDALENKPIPLVGWDGESGYIRRIARRVNQHGDVQQLSNRYDLTQLINVVNCLANESKVRRKEAASEIAMKELEEKRLDFVKFISELKT